MINFTLGQQWAKSCKEPDAWKTTKILTQKMDSGQEADCCLGRYCRLRKIKKVSNDYGEISWNNERKVLPLALKLELNITITGEVTREGAEFINQYFKTEVENIISLAEVNDEITTEDPTLFRMGCLIEWLIAEEYLFGREMFLPPN